MGRVIPSETLIDRGTSILEPRRGRAVPHTLRLLNPPPGGGGFLPGGSKFPSQVGDAVLREDRVSAGYRGVLRQILQKSSIFLMTFHYPPCHTLPHGIRSWTVCRQPRCPCGRKNGLVIVLARALITSPPYYEDGSSGCLPAYQECGAEATTLSAVWHSQRRARPRSTLSRTLVILGPCFSLSARGAEDALPVRPERLLGCSGADQARWPRRRVYVCLLTVTLFGP
jgi:hypothetical protein